MHRFDDFNFNQIPVRWIQTACLSLVALMTFFVMVLGRAVHPPLWSLMVLLLNVTGVLFFGVTIREPMSRTGRKLMLLGLGFCAWYLLLLLTDFRHFSTVSYYGPRFVYQTCLCEYLLLLPYAAVCHDGEKAVGLRIMGVFYSLSTTVLLLFTVLLAMGIIPPGMKSLLKWDLFYLAIGWEPNILATIFMMGILMKGIFLCTGLKPWWKGLLILSMGLELCALALTDSKTVFILTCGVLGGLVFFRIYRGGWKKPDWKRLILGIASGAAVAACLLAVLLAADKLNVAIFDSEINQRPHMWESAEIELEKREEDRLEQGLAPLTEEEKNAKLEEMTADHKPTNPRPVPENPLLRKLDSVLRLGGRREIWTMTLREIAKQPQVLLFGTRDVTKFINEHGYGMELLGYNPAHTHNAWLQTLLQTGLVGFLFALYFTWLALKNGCILLFKKQSSLFQKGIALLVFAIMGAEFMEPDLFFVEYPYNFANILFLLCLGYLVCWAADEKQA